MFPACKVAVIEADRAITAHIEMLLARFFNLLLNFKFTSYFVDKIKRKLIRLPISIITHFNFTYLLRNTIIRISHFVNEYFSYFFVYVTKIISIYSIFYCTYNIRVCNNFSIVIAYNFYFVT